MGVDTMSLFYEEIKDTGIVYVDAQEKERAERFKKHLDEYLDNTTKTKLEEMDILKDKRENNEEYFQVKSLEYGDYAFNNVVVEFKNYEDFKTSIRQGTLTTQIEDMYAHSGFKDCALVIVCDNPTHFWNDGAQWKGVVRFNSKVNVFVASSEQKAFEFITHFFWLGGKHISQAPRSRMRKNSNYAMNLLWATRSLSDKQIRAITKKTGISTMPDVLELFGKYSAKELSDKLSIRGVTEKRIRKCKSILEGRILL